MVPCITPLIGAVVLSATRAPEVSLPRKCENMTCVEFADALVVFGIPAQPLVTEAAGPTVPPAAIVMEKVPRFADPLESVTAMLRPLVVPAPEGVPVIVPTEVENERPAGSVPVSAKEREPQPPETVGV